MKKVTFLFLLIFIIALFFLDVEVVTLSPLAELKALLKGVFSPKISMLFELWRAAVNTLVFAFCGVAFAVIVGAVTTPLYRFRLFRIVVTMVRSVHEIFWAFILLPLVGLNAVCGCFAIAIPYSAIFCKRLYEIYKDSDLRPASVIPGKLPWIIRFLFGAFPILFEEVRAFSSYRFECALRSSAVLGFIGLPTIGYHLESYFKEGYYSEAFALLLFFYILIALKKYWLRLKIVPLYVLGSFILLSKEIHILPENWVRFFTYDIVPWPMKRTGFIEGTNTLEFAFPQTYEWLQKLWQSEIQSALLQTVVLTQISFVLAGVFAILGLFFIHSKTSKVLIRFIGKFVLVISRTTPEYLITYVAILLWGPSMLPGVIALVVHNGAVVTILTIKRMEQIELPVDAPKKGVSRFIFFLLPQVYAAFLGNLFYRWEVMVRESALLGVLGIYTLGFYVDSAIVDDKMDKAMILLVVIALLNCCVDFCSCRIRSYIRSS